MGGRYWQLWEGAQHFFRIKGALLGPIILYYIALEKVKMQLEFGPSFSDSDALSKTESWYHLNFLSQISSFHFLS